MVDEKMLMGIKNALDKVDSYKNRKDIGVVLSEYGVSEKDLNDESIISYIVKYLLNDEERFYFNQYQMYFRQKEMGNISSIINSLSDLTELVDILYNERKEAGKSISYINEIIRKIKIKLHDFPMIRLGSLYGHLEKDYKRYSSTTIKAGLEESKISDTIYNIEHGSFILRQMKTKELARLKKELAKHKDDSSKNIEEKHERYIRTQEEYTKELENAVLELLRDPEILNAVMLSLNLLYKFEYDTEFNSHGLETVKSQELKDVSKKQIIDKFFVYFGEHNGEKYDPQTFYNLLEKFILYFYTFRIEKLEIKRSKCLSQIGSAFEKQKEMMSQLSGYKGTLNGGTVSLTDDENDTLSLVYTMNGK